MITMYFVLICALCAAAARSAPQTFVVTNHQNEVAYTQELVRLQVDIRGANASAISVLEDGVAVPYQVSICFQLQFAATADVAEMH